MSLWVLRIILVSQKFRRANAQMLHRHPSPSSTPNAWKCVSAAASARCKCILQMSCADAKFETRMPVHGADARQVGE
eukprot:1133586-Karenia_brevis.AAC.1